MLINFGVVKDFKSSDKYIQLKSALTKGHISFSKEIDKLKSYNLYSSDITHVNGTQ
jgi:hypothetical protein